ncbi:MAG: EamA family transporter [Opitutaceae bacterium]|nr:EamA family transporter [Opitutaceae bacterium]
MTSPAPARSSVIIALATIYVVWGSTYLAIKVAVETMPPFAMAAFRFLISGLLLLLFLGLRGCRRPTLRQWVDNTIIGSLLLLGGNGLVVWAERIIDSGITALLIGIGPLFVVLTEWIWPGGQRPTAGILGALLLGLAGVVWLAAPWESPHNGGLPFNGVAAILFACVCWAVGSIYSRHAKSSPDPFQAAALQMLGGSFGLFLTAWAIGDFTQLDLAAISARSWWALGFLVSVGSLVGFSTFVWLMKNVSPALASTFAYVNPIVAVFLGWWLLDEAVSARTFGAAAVIIAAVVIITVQKNRRGLAVPPRQAVAAADAGKSG